MLLRSFAIVSAIALSAGSTRSTPAINTSLSYERLGQLQDSLCKSHQEVICSFTSAQCIEEITRRWGSPAEAASAKDYIKQLCESRRSESETPGVHLMLQAYKDKILGVLPQLGRSLSEEPALGSLPLREINASVTSNTDEKVRIVAVNDGLFLLSIAIPKIAAISVPHDAGQVDTSVEATMLRLRSQPEILENFALSILASNGAGDYPDLPDAEGLDAPITIAFLQGIELFALAHEYSHILLGHTGKKATLMMDDPCSPASAIGDASELQNNWIEEVEADVLAQKIVNEIAAEQISRGEGNIIVDRALPWGPGFYFFMMEMRRDARFALDKGRLPPKASKAEEAAAAIVLKCLDRPGCSPSAALSEARSPVLSMRSHPSPAIRRMIVEHGIANPGASQLDDDSRKALQIVGTAYRNTGLMWSLWRSRLVELHRGRFQSRCAIRGGSGR